MNRMIRVSRGTLFAVAVAFAGSAFAQAPAPAGDGQWAKSHPRREEVNARLANHRIRMDERAMASTNGGHIKKTEKRAPEQQEHHVNTDIGHRGEPDLA